MLKFEVMLFFSYAFLACVLSCLIEVNTNMTLGVMLDLKTHTKNIFERISGLASNNYY